MNEATGVAVSGYSADTEILTRTRSWVAIDQLTYLDEVATRTPDGIFTWEHPVGITWRHYQGEMVAFRSQAVALLAAPATVVPYLHRRQTKAAGKVIARWHEERDLRAADHVGRPVSLVATSTWAPGRPAAEITLKAERAYSYGGRLGKKPKDFTATSGDFAAFMGMWLAEGSLWGSGAGDHEIWVWQKHMGRGYLEFQELIDRAAGHHVNWVKKGGWHFGNKGLFAYLKACGGYAWTKIIPARILDLPREHLEIFWRYYWLGDGTTMSAGTGRKSLDVVSTASPAMAGNLQEILQKLGGWALIQVIDGSKYAGNIGKTKRLTHRLVRRSSTIASASAIEAVPYNGMIGDVRTGIGPVYVRRNYRPVWAGA
jgi:hypothetical protein